MKKEEPKKRKVICKQCLENFVRHKPVEHMECYLMIRDDEGKSDVKPPEVKNGNR